MPFTYEPILEESLSKILNKLLENEILTKEEIIALNDNLYIEPHIYLDNTIDQDVLLEELNGIIINDFEAKSINRKNKTPKNKTIKPRNLKIDKVKLNKIKEVYQKFYEDFIQTAD
jgi:hypothetical protein